MWVWRRMANASGSCSYSSSTSHTSQAFQLGKHVFFPCNTLKILLCNVNCSSAKNSKSKYSLKYLHIPISRFSIMLLSASCPGFSLLEPHKLFHVPLPWPLMWLCPGGWIFMDTYGTSVDSSLSLWPSHFTSTRFWQQPFSSKTQSQYSYLFPLCQHFMTVATSQTLY